MEIGNEPYGNLAFLSTANIYQKSILRKIEEINDETKKN